MRWVRSDRVRLRTWIETVAFGNGLIPKGSCEGAVCVTSVSLSKAGALPNNVGSVFENFHPGVN